MPLLFDMPVEKLKTYTGTNPRPADFDTYWDRALAEMRAVNAKVDISPAEYQTPFAECSHLTFTGVGGSRVYAKLLRPRQQNGAQPAIIMFHGYSMHSGIWTDKLPYVAMGYTVAALDCRGQGGRSEDLGGAPGNTLNGHIIRGLDGKPDQLLFRQIFLDTAQLAGIVMGLPGVDPNRVGAMGGSQGGGLTLACAALEPRIKRVAPVFPFLCDYKRVWDMDQAVAAYAELKEYFKRFDPCHAREHEVFLRLGYIDVQHLAPRIRGEVMMAVGFMDTICPPSTQFAAYNKITAPKSLVTYPDFGHEDLPGHADRTFQFMAKL
ncbi:MAG: acetylxylan esterase [Lentisphaerae bacterium]|nr:acetylxylan esterase [Lentisphaerota bacterium]